MFSWL